MRFFSFSVLLLIITVFIGWLNSRLLARLFPFWRARPVRYGYLLLTAAAVFVMVYFWPRRPSLMFPEGELYLFLVYISLGWLSSQLFLIVLQPLLYVAHRLAGGRKAVAADGGAAEPEMSRRAFLHKALAAVPLVAFGAGGQGVYGAQTDLAVVRHTLVMPDLPANLDGFKIGQLSDTHVGPFFDLARLDQVLGRLAAEKPDLVVMTGDFADDLQLLRPAAKALAAMGAAVPHGVYFCWGNHEYFRDPAFIKAVLEDAGIKILKNASDLIAPGTRPFYLLGADYPPTVGTQRTFKIAADQRAKFFAAANGKVPPGAFRVLIAHHPDFLNNAFDAGVPLTLAGHTHGGQVVIGGKPLLTTADYMRGLYSDKGAYGYVSSGVGHWFPFRFGCPPEVSVFTLRA